MHQRKKLIMFAHPRSCSTYLMKQFDSSPFLNVIDTNNYELITPTNRLRTAKFLNLPDTFLDNASDWDHDELYISECFRQYPGIAFKLMAYVHKFSLIDYLIDVHQPIIVTIQRKDRISTLASIINKSIREIQDPESSDEIWTYPSKHDKQKMEYGRLFNSVNRKNDKRRKYLTDMYFTILNKTKYYMDTIEKKYSESTNLKHYSFYTEEFGYEFRCPQLEDELEIELDFDEYVQPSHYSEIFSDWEYFRDDVCNVLGDIQHD